MKGILEMLSLIQNLLCSRTSGSLSFLSVIKSQLGKQTIIGNTWETKPTEEIDEKEKYSHGQLDENKVRLKRDQISWSRMGEIMALHACKLYSQYFMKPSLCLWIAIIIVDTRVPRNLNNEFVQGWIVALNSCGILPSEVNQMWLQVLRTLQTE